MKKKIAIPLVIGAGLLLVWGLVSRDGKANSAYRFVEIERGTVESVVSSTGALQAITTVEVGTQVSGQIAEIYVDFNDRVRKGQLVARIDPTILQQEVRAAESNLERNRAELEQTRRELERMKQLHERKVATESDYDTAEYQYAVAQASYRSAEVNLERAQRNLNYSEIRAPIDGVVLDRTVDVGQTVAASFSAPQLFLIAEDLSKMEILAAVDESDIGQIHEGQPVRFTVQAYPDEPFSGTVGQVRLQSSTVENVVSYTVAVAVENPDGRLLPGMTATVEFIIAQATDVLKVPNAALRFRPTSDMVAALQERKEARASRGEGGDSTSPGEAAADSLGAGVSRRAGWRSGRAQRGAAEGSSSGGAGGHALLWFVDEDGKVNAAPVRTGITDGQSTEVQGPGIQEKMQVIAAVANASSSSAVSNPFQSQETRRFHGPPGGM